PSPSPITRGRRRIRATGLSWRSRQRLRSPPKPTETEAAQAKFWLDKGASDRLRNGLCLSALGAPRQRLQTSAITPGVPGLYRDGDQCLAPRQRRVLISLAS